MDGGHYLYYFGTFFNMNLFPFFIMDNLQYLNQLNYMNNYYLTLFQSLLANNQMPSSPSNTNISNIPKGEANFNKVQNQPIEPKNDQEKNYFKVNYKQSGELFTKNNLNNNLNDTEETNHIGRKRASFRRRRKENQDNIRRKIKRGFLNSALIKILNAKLKNIGSTKYFKKFPEFFASDIDRKRNKKILDITLKEIFEKKELYKENDLENYLHNFQVVQNKEITENEEFKKILNKTFCELYEDYLNSKEFQIDEINRLKKYKMENDYIQRYIYLSKHLIEFFNQGA